MFYDLEEYSLKDIDKYMWQLGKEKFPNKVLRKEGESGGNKL